MSRNKENILVFGKEQGWRSCAGWLNKDSNFYYFHVSISFPAILMMGFLIPWMIMSLKKVRIKDFPPLFLVFELTVSALLHS